MSCPINPARSINTWLGISAPSGVSFIVGIRDWLQRTARLLQSEWRINEAAFYVITAQSSKKSTRRLAGFAPMRRATQWLRAKHGRLAGDRRGRSGYDGLAKARSAAVSMRHAFPTPTRHVETRRWLRIS